MKKKRAICFYADEREQTLVKLNRERRGLRTEAEYLRQLVNEDSKKNLEKNLPIGKSE